MDAVFTEIDFDAAAIDDIDSSKTSVNGKQMLGEIDAQPQRSDSDLTKKAAPKKRRRAPSNLSRKPSASGTSLMTRFDPIASSTTGMEDLWHAIFVNPTGKEPSRSTSSDIPYVGVCIWPQYQISGLNGSYAVVAQGEQWLDRIFYYLKCRSSAKNPTESIRNLMPTFNRTIIEMLKNGLSALRQKEMHETDIEVIDDDDGHNTPTVKSLSGFKLNNVPVVQVTIAGITFKVVNFAKMMIVKVDNDGIQFMSTVIVDVVRKLTPQDNESVYQPEAPFQFDVDLRNIKDKIVWDPDENGWQVRAKAAKAKAKGKNATKSQPSIKEPEQPCIKVPNNLEGEQWEYARRVAYAKAINIWNDTDFSKRARIKELSDVCQTCGKHQAGAAMCQTCV